MPERPHRVPSADWRTEHLEDLWKASKPSDTARFEGSLHRFLEYCCVLRGIRQQFENDDSTVGFDDCVFFLRGGYFVFKYLNMTSSMALRATIFGGLSHGRNPKLELPRFIDELHDRVLSSGKSHANLLIVDEVQSGSGMGQILKLIKKAMRGWPNSCSCDVNTYFYAIRPGSEDTMTDQLRVVARKRQGRYAVGNSFLFVNIKHFAGPLPGYDSDTLCGLKRVSSGADQNEAYEILKSAGGIATLTCDETKARVFESSISGSLVEFLSSCAVAWTNQLESAQSRNIAQGIELFGCSDCRKLYDKATGRL
jgi:hypothetical protein